jgi:hypothetical protein
MAGEVPERTSTAAELADHNARLQRARHPGPDEIVAMDGTNLAAAVDVWLPEWLWDASLSRLAVRLYALLALYALQDLPAPPAAALARQLRCRRGQVYTAMRELHAMPITPAWMLHFQGVPAG